jgi:thiol-disulfide isomerase/thioredoxin
MVLAACGDRTVAQDPAKSRRADAVTVDPQAKVDVAGFCDLHKPGEDAPKFALPELEAPPPAAREGWRWINVWATWCKPCVEELPLLDRLRGKFDSDHLPMELLFLSVDENAQIVTDFKTKHPDIPESLRIKDHNALGAWLGTIGLDESSALPIHLFVDPDARVRCVRMGQVSEKDYAVVKGLVRQG